MDDAPSPRKSGPNRLRRSARAILRVVTMMAIVGALGVGIALRGDEVAATAGTWLEEGARSVRELLLGDVRVGLQIGHMNADEHPAEHARLRISTGGEANGVTEVEINRAVAEATAARLEAAGVTVDLLPASVPPRYRADLVVSIHADSSPDPDRRGFKTAHFEPARTPQERTLKALLDAAYATHTGLPDDHENVSGNMLWYYAFDPRYRHAVSPVTPAVLLEMGYISNGRDLSVLKASEVPAEAIADGILAYLDRVGRLPEP